MSGSLDALRHVRAQVLLLRRKQKLTPHQERPAAPVQQALPGAGRVELPGLNHSSPWNKQVRGNPRPIRCGTAAILPGAANAAPAITTSPARTLVAEPMIQVKPGDSPTVRAQADDDVRVQRHQHAGIGEPARFRPRRADLLARRARERRHPLPADWLLGLRSRRDHRGVMRHGTTMEVEASSPTPTASPRSVRRHPFPWLRPPARIKRLTGTGCIGHPLANPARGRGWNRR